MQIINGDCLDELARLPDASIHAVVTDPPYGLGNTSPENVAACLRAWLDGERHDASGGGFMGREWDSWVPGPEVWRECLRVLKPGGHVLAFAGTRTVDLMALALRLAGFEIRDMLAWHYGSGFPKSHNLAREWSGWGTALKPSWEPIILARKPLTGTVAANVLEHGAGALNVNGCRVEAPTAGRWPPNAVLVHPPHCDGDRNGRGCVEGCPVGEMGRQSGEGSCPAEVGRGAGGQNGAFSPIAAQGRVPSHDDSGTAARFFYQAKASRAEREAGVGGELRDANKWNGGGIGERRRQAGMGRRRNHHPTVKPVDLMRWLVRLVTPPGGTVLDPFTGSGTTGCACAVEGFEFIGIEREPEYADIARQRVAWWSEHGERAIEAQAARDAADAEDAATGQTRLFDW
jgi:DNA modification methylase